jgi:Fe-S-cluster containining protein
VEKLPEPRRTEIRNRFAEAHRRFEEASLLPRLRQAETWTDAEYGDIAQKYFDQHIACPFLEEESCSIYADRPITCREYLVTSPAENCAHPTAENTNRLKLPLKVFNAVARWQVPPTTHFEERWLPLILALEFAATNPDDPPPKPGVELVRELLDQLTHKQP